VTLDVGDFLRHELPPFLLVSASIVMSPADFFFLAIGETSALDLFMVLLIEYFPSKLLPPFLINLFIAKVKRFSDVFIYFVSQNVLF
jgi:hypothetical protein